MRWLQPTAQNGQTPMCISASWMREVSVWLRLLIGVGTKPTCWRRNPPKPRPPVVSCLPVLAPDLSLAIAHRSFLCPGVADLSLPLPACWGACDRGIARRFPQDTCPDVLRACAYSASSNEQARATVALQRRTERGRTERAWRASR